MIYLYDVLPLLSSGRQVVLRTEDMDLAGELIQTMGNFLNIEDLQSVADFPNEMERLRQVLEKV